MFVSQANAPARSTRAGSDRGAHLPALDGVRGLAVLGVLLFHGGVSAVKGGFLGVDAFFVLSGFLITGLLLREWETAGRLSLTSFWTRRVRRLLPALLLLVTSLVIAGRLDPSLRRTPGLAGDMASTLGYVANWHLIATGGNYFVRTGPPSPLEHTWSLAIEEQFYLVWPLVLLLVLRRRRSIRALRTVACAGAAISALDMAVLAGHSSIDRIYYGTDTRAFALLIGAVLATVVPLSSTPSAAWRARELRAAGIVSVLVLGYLWHSANGSSVTLFRGQAQLAALAVAVVLASALKDPAGPLAQGLRLPALRGLGIISYGLYLWHWPIFLLLSAERTGETGVALLCLRIAASITAATLSYVLVERPLRRGVVLPRWQAPAVLLPATCLLLLVAVVASAPPHVPRVTARPLPVLPAVHVRTTSPDSPRPAAPTMPVRAHPGPTRVLVLGDSVAETLFDGMPSYPQVAVVNDAVLGCGLLHESPYRYIGQVDAVPSQCDGWPGTWLGDVRSTDPDVVALLVGRWEVMDRMIDGRWQSVGDPDFDQHVLADLNRVLPLLTSRGARVALLTPPYYHRTERPDGGLYPEDVPRRVDLFTALLRRFAAEHPHTVSIVDLGGRMSPAPDTYSSYIDGVFARYDGVHVTPQAATLLAPWLLPRLIQLDPRRTTAPVG